ncbi:circadian clock protein KaiB [Rhodoblastus acidophilus]|uniref:circadian clock KaiB family protein n=1 Tax=Rhodoblastus acidophilus TaxID=1074 RepID=UPI002225A390|nr:circadian clock KaiB family protein [Rhodoblastus acidophilus]MCW2285893.1 circadian clock protein KaiB [Rhodoblastus acidophilus]MCW2334806.1 circadian clock protein KaiB [Rhodoblastus acidophilus]
MNDEIDAERWRLRLYIAGGSPRSLAALANLKRVCEDYLPGRYELEVIDLTEEPERARADQIVAIPTLVRRLPPPITKIIGDLSLKERVVVALDIEPMA